jgi:hypothetical protein
MRGSTWFGLLLFLPFLSGGSGCCPSTIAYEPPLTVAVSDLETGAPISAAHVDVATQATVLSCGDGCFNVAAGSGVSQGIVVSADGYKSAQFDIFIAKDQCGYAVHARREVALARTGSDRISEVRTVTN